jgi:nucleoside-triphosphatase
MAAKILLTGLPGSGKTEVVRKVVERLGDRAVGFFTADERDAKGFRTGFAVETVDGKRGELARKASRPGPRVGSYVVNVSEFEAVVLPSLRIDEDKVVVIDEIGKMECLSEAFKTRVLTILDASVSVLGTIPLRWSDRYVEEIRNRPDIEVIRVTPANRDRLPEELAPRLLGEIP